MAEQPLVVGTRGSRLALQQAKLVVALLREAHPDRQFEVRVIQTLGDREVSRSVSQIGDKGVFVRAIEEALLAGEIDLAVHSLKDVPGDAEIAGLTLAAFSAREEPRDVLISRSGVELGSLPKESRIGTSSPRRRVELYAVRPDLQAVDIRGNVDTRLRKLAEGEYDGIILAAAGLLRLGLHDAITQYLPWPQFLPDAGQGIMAIQTRAGSEAERVASAVDDPHGRVAAVAERAVARALDADCRSPIGALAQILGDRIQLYALTSPDGRKVYRASAEGPANDAEPIGWSVGMDLARRMAAEGSYTEA